MKNTFQQKDNIINKNLEYHLLNDYKFTDPSHIIPVSNDIRHVYAKYFTDGDMNKAKKTLEKNNYAMKKEDLFVLSFMLGGIFIFIVFLSFFVFI